MMMNDEWTSPSADTLNVSNAHADTVITWMRERHEQHAQPMIRHAMHDLKPDDALVAIDAIHIAMRLRRDGNQEPAYSIIRNTDISQIVHDIIAGYPHGFIMETAQANIRIVKNML